jgi:extracellular elastinolytic metalloproteinase
VEVDALTGTPREVARLDGFLTGPSDRGAKSVALDYVRAHARVFRLDADDLARLRLVRDYGDVGGTRHLVWAQTSRGIPALDNDLRASVTSDGRLVNVLGSPVPDLQAPTTTPRLGAAEAVGAALRSAGRSARSLRTVAAARNAQRTTRFAGGHRAALELFWDGHAARLVWRVTAHADEAEIYDTVVDAASGAVLQQTNRVESVDALAWDYYPGASSGGTQTTRDITAWLKPSVMRLIGPNAHVFPDVDDNDIAVDGGGSEEVAPTSGNWNYAFTPFTHSDGFCSPTFASVCSWDSFSASSWQTNRAQNATQAFYFVNTFHDYLEAPPIGFNAAAGGFDSDDDILEANTDDGADLGTAGVFLGQHMPDQDHFDNANMFTPPDGQKPRMQMYLFTSPTGPSGPDFVPIPDVNGGDDASIVYHEYTHGLSNRLITYADGWGALDAHQPGSMGEGWSDWYAMDYLVGEGFQPDDPAVQGEVAIGAYADGGNLLLRTEGLDCLRGTTPACPGTSRAGQGGYTFGDLGKVYDGGPEVHADGEIWGQTLWQLRGKLIEAHGQVDGENRVRTLVTRAMELSVRKPSFLNMRNAILQADMVATGGEDRERIWSVFANRGMGFLAWTAGPNSVSTVQDFSLPRTFTCFGEKATKVGTNGADVITGTNGRDVIVGLGGNDKINGKGGKDLICGGGKADTLTGGGGVDKFDGGPGSDTFFSRDGVRERSIKGGTGTDRVRKDRSDRTTGVERTF